MVPAGLIVNVVLPTPATATACVPGSMLSVNGALVGSPVPITGQARLAAASAESSMSHYSRSAKS